MKRNLPSCLIFAVLTLSSLVIAGENLIPNPSFETGATGWDSLWAREQNRIKAAVVAQPTHEGKSAWRVEHAGPEDWALGNAASIPVKPGEVYAFSAWVKIEQGEGSVECSVVTRDSAGKVLNWQHGAKQLSGGRDWQNLRGRFLIPERCANIHFRLMGRGPVTAVFDDIQLLKEKEAAEFSIPNIDFALKDGGTQLIFSPSKESITISQIDAGPAFAITAWQQGILSAVEQTQPNRLRLSFLGTEGSDWTGEISIDDRGSINFTANGTGPLDAPVDFPGPIQSKAGQNWVVPINEGLLIPAHDPHFFTWDEVLYSGHGLCMPFLGLVEGEKGFIAIAETQNDARVHFQKPSKENSSTWTFCWEPSKGEWGYTRRLRIEMIGAGGYVGVAKAYRAWAKNDGRLVTLKEKAATVPQLEKLIGAVNFWWWEKGEWWSRDPEPERIGRELKAAGIERVLWSQEARPASIKALNELGFLTGRYDIYQDVWGPDAPGNWLNRDGWPADQVQLRNGEYMKGWVHKENGKEYPGGVISSKPGLDRLLRKVKDDLATHNYGARFLDTTTASPLREDYNLLHPLSRGDDRHWKMKQLAALSEEFKLVTGSETGMDMAVPFLHYFEGMTSLGPYRLPDAGYDLFSYKKPDDNFLRFQTGPFYRIPLFELVYHDCIVSYGYWGDATNRIPEVWDDRDLFCALYGTPPIFVTDRARWNKDKARYIQSYKKGTETARLTGHSEMLDHRFLNASHTLQSTTFSEGTTVYVNFGPESEKLPDGTTLDSKTSLIFPGRK